MIDDKIELINKLLKDDMKFNEYISGIDSKDIKVPTNLNTKIYSYIRNSDNHINKKDSKFFNILKIAACAIFAIIVWKVSLDNLELENSYKYSKNIYDTKENIHAVMNSFSDILMKPSDIKGGEK